MSKTSWGRALVASVCVLVGVSAGAAGQESPAGWRFEAAATYNPVLANVTTGSQFWMQGGSAQVEAGGGHGLGAVADVARLHNGTYNSGAGLDLLTATFGPRYTWTPGSHRTRFYGQVLAGEAHGLHGVFPSASQLNSTATSFALQMGGGVDLAWTRHLSVRVLEANWLRTQLANGTTNVQNNLRLGVGMVWRLP